MVDDDHHIHPANILISGIYAVGAGLNDSVVPDDHNISNCQPSSTVATRGYISG